MSLLGPLVVVSETPAPELVGALAEAGAFPVIESRWTDAPAAFTAIQPTAIVLAQPGPAADPQAAHTLGLQLRTRNGPFVPLISRATPNSRPPLPDELPVGADASIDRLVARLRSALRVRALHVTVLRRAETLAAQTGRVAQFPDSDPLEDATVLVAGRGGSYPGLAVAVGEHVGLIGALSIETAAHYLNARDIDGIVIGDGFGAPLIEALLTALGEDARFRDLPVALVSKAIDSRPFSSRLANLEPLHGDPEDVLQWLLPLVRLHAFESRLKRMLKVLDANGLLDAETGMMTEEAFAAELVRAVDEAVRCGHGLCMARFVFDPRIDRRTSMDAARLIGNAIRKVDFGCREEDGSVVVAFPATDLQTAHLVARRVAGTLKDTMLTTAPDVRQAAPAITLAKLKSDDTIITLLTRLGCAVAAVPAGA